MTAATAILAAAIILAGVSIAYSLSAVRDKFSPEAIERVLNGEGEDA